MNREKVRQALTRLDAQYRPTNAAVIAECIRMELSEARACDDSASEAEARVERMLREEFIYASVTSAFKLDERTNFARWGVSMKYPTGDAFRVCELD